MQKAYRSTWSSQASSVSSWTNSIIFTNFKNSVFNVTYSTTYRITDKSIKMLYCFTLNMFRRATSTPARLRNFATTWTQLNCTIKTRSGTVTKLCFSFTFSCFSIKPINQYSNTFPCKICFFYVTRLSMNKITRFSSSTFTTFTVVRRYRNKVTCFTCFTSQRKIRSSFSKFRRISITLRRTRYRNNNRHNGSINLSTKTRTIKRYHRKTIFLFSNRRTSIITTNYLPNFYRLNHFRLCGSVVFTRLLTLWFLAASFVSCASC